MSASPGPPTVGPGSFPPPSTFQGMAHHTTVILNRTLYIDGGLISARGSQGVLGDNNNTFTLDLSTSWTNQTISFGVIPKPGVPIVHYAASWPASDGASFYSLGGLSAYGPAPSDAGIWQFMPDQRGNGTWTRVPDRPSSGGFRPRARPGGAGAAAGNGKGYLLGGVMTVDNAEAPPFSAAPGLVTFDMAANSWTNDSVSTVFPNGVTTYGRIEYVPNFGDEGVLLAFGGQGTNDSLMWAGDMEYPLGLDSIAVYDIATKKWHKQRATGRTSDAVPSMRESFCSLGTAGNDTYEIVLYGGEAGNHYWSPHNPTAAAANATNAAKTGIHVLSLPSFTWFKANDTSAQPRYGHTCSALPGDRQMVSVGGINASVWADAGLFTTDSLTYGLGVFDMTELRWKPGFDTNAGRYSTPAAIRDFYAQGAPGRPAWDDPELEPIFKYRAAGGAASTNTTDAGPDARQSGTPSTGSSSSANSKWAIVGGAIGGALFLVVALLVVFAFLRRRRANRQSCEPPSPSELFGQEKLELPERSFYEPKKSPLRNGTSSWRVKSTAPIPRELDSEHKSELVGSAVSNGPSELPSASTESSPRSRSSEPVGEVTQQWPDKPRWMLRSELNAEGTLDTKRDS